MTTMIAMPQPNLDLTDAQKAHARAVLTEIVTRLGFDARESIRALFALDRLCSNIPSASAPAVEFNKAELKSALPGPPKKQKGFG